MVDPETEVKKISKLLLLQRSLGGRGKLARSQPAQRMASRCAYFDAHAAQKPTICVWVWGGRRGTLDWNARAAGYATATTPRHSESQKAFPAFQLEQLPCVRAFCSARKESPRSLGQISSGRPARPAPATATTLLHLVLLALICSSAPSYAVAVMRL